MKLLIDPKALYEAALPPGTVHTWTDGKDYEKQNDGSWTPVNLVKKKAKAHASAHAEISAQKEREAKEKGVQKEPAPKAKTPPEDEAQPHEVAQSEEEAEQEEDTIERAELTKTSVTDDPTTPIPKGHEEQKMKPSPKASRVGVAGDATPPPPGIGRLPNLTPQERQVESSFADAFEADPDKFSNSYYDTVKKSAEQNGWTFETDAVKLQHSSWNPQGKVDPAEVLDRRSSLNYMLHQTANAISKRAFSKRLDELAKLPEDDPQRTVTVTCGGCAAGKSYAVQNVASVNELVKKTGATWDAAGEQNATENPWVLNECRKRGLKALFVFVDADPNQIWDDPKRGVMERANKQGRMIDARIFAESHVLGARNHAAFYEKEKESEDAGFVFLSNRGGTLKQLDSVPDEAKNVDVDMLVDSCLKKLDANTTLKPAVKRGGQLIARRVARAEEAAAAAA